MVMAQPLDPPATVAQGRWSVAFPRQWWYPACATHELGRKPLGITLVDEPIVLFRDAGGVPRALVDRCPHRNVPLSLGRVRPDGTLQCGYHGWCFDGGGRCTAVPALGIGVGQEPSARDATRRWVREEDGFVWIWGSPDVEPTRDPFALPQLGAGPTVGQVVFRRDMECTVHASVENALDVPHTAFLHGGLFRKDGTGPRVEAERTDLVDGVEVRYVGEPAAFGPLRLPGGATFDHWDRFFLPSIAQVEYRVGDALRITNSILHLPLSPTRTRAWFVLRFRSPLPAAVAGPIIRARGRKILQQDVDVLEAQTRNIRRFGGERYTSTDLDLLGNAIWRLMRQAEKQEQGPDHAEDARDDREAGSQQVTLHL
jgi:phenylpropionate dioxygenase-like ring-hydroxylating dioxygenase large terminal subunit